jgi:hypothetical protein
MGHIIGMSLLSLSKWHGTALFFFYYSLSTVIDPTKETHGHVYLFG